MEFEIRNAQGDVLKLFASPGDKELRFEVIPAAAAKASAAGASGDERPLVAEEEGPPVG